MKDLKLNAEIISVEELCKTNLYEIADYQRPYSWIATDQVEDFISDLIQSFKENQGHNESQPLFIGTVYTKLLETKAASSNKYELIDGQQRIITLALIFLSLYGFASRKDTNISSKPDMMTIKNCLWKYIARDYVRELNLISSGSIEKELLKNLFNSCYDNPAKFNDYIQSLNSKNVIEKNLLEAIKLISEKISNELNLSTNVEKKQDWLLDFSVFLLHNVKMIFAIFDLTRKNIFEIFESINSKGKQLEDIDLIKTYIFSQFSELDAEQYLQKWGILIKETEDNLEEYLAIYIKAFIKHYKQSIKIKIFKNLLNDKAVETFYSSSNKEIILKKMIDDLVEKVGYYKALTDFNKFKTYINQKEINFHYNIFSLLKYEHPKPIIFKALYELNKSDKTKEDKINFCNIFKYLNSFMILFQTFNNQNSKSSISTIEKILMRYYDEDNISLKSEEIKEIISIPLSTKTNLDNFAEKLREIEGFKDNATEIGFVLLTISESYDENLKFSHNKANSFLESKPNYSVDHLLPQSPKQNDSNFRYYKGINEAGVSVLRLKENHDFPVNKIYDGMEYDSFKGQLLNKLGNLRLFPKDQNSSRQNMAINLFPKQNKFISYNQVKENMENLVQRILDSDVFFIPEKGLIINKDQFKKENNEGATFNLDFDNLQQVTGHKPKLIELFGQQYKVNSTNELTQKILEILYEQDHLIFQNILNSNINYGSAEHPWISNSIRALRKPQKIGDSNYYFEANKSAVDLLKMIKKIFIDNNKNLKELKIVYEF